MNLRLFAAASAAAIITAAVTGEAAAQTATPVAGNTVGNSPLAPVPQPPNAAPAISSAPSAGISEVIVTANRRRESANTVGMAITAVTPTALAQAGVQSAEDLASVVPGLTVAKGAGAPIYTLRGVGFNSTSSASTATVGIYVDEVAYAYPFMSRGPIFDVSRVEALKGPQGTLYGRNTTGGLIDTITNKPTDDLTSGLTAEFGNYQTHNFEGYFNLPVNSQLKARLAFRSEDSDEGWQESFTRPGDRLGALHKLGVRAEVEWTPTDRLDVNLSANYWQDHSDTEAAQFIGFTPTSVPAFYAPGLAAFAAAFHPNRDSTADWEPDSQREAPDGFTPGLPNPLQYNDNFNGIAIHANYKLADHLSLVSLTSYNTLSRDDTYDSSGTPYEVSGQIWSSGYTRSFSQEVRLDGQSGPVHWVFGGYYARDNILQLDRNESGQASGIKELQAISETLQAVPAFNPAGYSTAQIADGLRYYGDYGITHTNTWSLFGDATWDLTSKLSASAGIRYGEDHQHFAGCSEDRGNDANYIYNTIIRLIELTSTHVDPGVIGENQCFTYNTTTLTHGLVNETLDEDPLSWRANVDYKLTPAILLYATISRGVKAGDIPVLAANLSSQFTPAKQEELLAYEGGVKAGLFERRVQANLSVFYYDYTDKQLLGELPDPIYTVLTRLVNVPKSRDYGLDGDVAWKVDQYLTLNLAGTYVDTDITDYIGYNTLAQPVNFKGHQFTYSPKVQLTASLIYQRPINDVLGFRGGITNSYQGKSYGDIANSPLYDIKAFGLLNGTLGIYSLDGRWEASIWARNILNTYYWTSTFATADDESKLAGLPRTFGMKISHSF